MERGAKDVDLMEWTKNNTFSRGSKERDLLGKKYLAAADTRNSWITSKMELFSLLSRAAEREEKGEFGGLSYY